VRTLDGASRAHGCHPRRREDFDARRQEGLGQHDSGAATPLQPLWLNPRLMAVRRFAFEKQELSGVGRR
jgi:hypothetical protein